MEGNVLLTNEEVLRQSGLRLPAQTAGLSRDDAQTALAAYLVQGLNAPGNKRVRMEYDAEADWIAERAGAEVMHALADSVLPADQVTKDTLLEHPEWALVIGRYGGAEQIRHLWKIDADLCRSGYRGGRRLGYLIDEAFALSGQMEAAARGSSRKRRSWIQRHLFGSPYASCIPEGALIGPDGTGSVPSSRGLIHLSLTPEYRLRYTDPRDGKTAGSVPNWLFLKPEDRPLREAFAALQRYLTALRQELQDMLERMYLLSETMPGQWLTRITADPLMARYFRYVIFRQADTDFMLTPRGFTTADGGEYTPLLQDPVSVPHPFSLDEEVLSAFRAVPKRGYAKIPQLREPVYDVTDLPDVPRSYETSIGSEDGKPVLILRSNLYIPHGIRQACKQYNTGSFYKQYEFPIRAGDPILNHILYQIDLSGCARRIRQDDLRLLPLLRINGPRRALKEAIKAGAARLTAALLEELNSGKGTGTGDLRL